MRAILISIKPKWVAKILNGEKTIEIRKTMPKCDLPIDVYIYCTKGKKYSSLINRGGFLTGMVVAKFTLNKVEHILAGLREWTWDDEIILNKSCLTIDELIKYTPHLSFYAWHIDNLEIFDKPKELSEFMKTSCKGCPFENTQTCHNDIEGMLCRLTKAPQSFCYVEVE